MLWLALLYQTCVMIWICKLAPEHTLNTHWAHEFQKDFPHLSQGHRPRHLLFRIGHFWRERPSLFPSYEDFPVKVSLTMAVTISIPFIVYYAPDWAGYFSHVFHLLLLKIQRLYGYFHLGTQ